MNTLITLGANRIIFIRIFPFDFAAGWLEGSRLDGCGANVLNVWRTDLGCCERKHGFGWTQHRIQGCMGHRSYRGTNVSIAALIPESNSSPHSIDSRFDINPTIRHSLWSQIIGGLFYWIQTNAVSQNMIQRYLALPTLKAGRRALWIFVGGVISLMMLCSYNGLLIYATYKDCDPLTTKLAQARDQLLPLFVMDTLGGYPGLSGLFIAGVFSAALSSLSTCLNSMSAVVLEDFVKPFVKRPLSNFAINCIMRSVVVFVGIICVALVSVVAKMGTVLQLTMSLEAITNGPLFGIFTMGLLMPWISSNVSFGKSINYSFSF